MARIRTVKPEFWTSEQILECSTNARLLFIGMWNFCDDGGVHVASLKRLKAEVFPADDFTIEDVRRLIDELVANDLVVEFCADDRRFWKVTGWKHQKIDRPNPKYPQPEADGSANDRRTIAPGRESRGGEGKGRDSARPEPERVAARDVGEPGEESAAPTDEDAATAERTTGPIEDVPTTGPIEDPASSEPEVDGRELPPRGAEPEPPNPAVEVIAAFDAERARVFGANQARPHPNATDLGAAKAMLDGGSDLETCRFVFRATFERQKAAGKRPAGLLRYMRGPVAEALVDPLAIPEKFRRTAKGARLRNPSDVQRENRIESYLRAVAERRTPYWQDDWGAPPAVEADG